MKKKFIIKSVAFALLAVAFGSCDAILEQDRTDFGKGPVLTTFSTPVTEVNIIKDAANTPVNYEFEISYAGGKNVALNRPVSLTIGTSATSEAKEGVEFELPTKTFTIPAGETSAMASIKILTGGLVPFDFKDIVLEITDSSESIAELNTITITLKALGANSLAGEYEVIDGDYWRLGVNNGWGALGGHRTIEAISETEYRHPDYFGLFAGQFFFTVDSNNKVLISKTNLIDGSVILQGTAPVLTCEQNSSSLTNVHCGESNYVIRTNDRHDIIYLTYGYNTPGSGPREFYEVLRRIE